MSVLNLLNATEEFPEIFEKRVLLNTIEIEVSADFDDPRTYKFLLKTYASNKFKPYSVVTDKEILTPSGRSYRSEAGLFETEEEAIRNMVKLIIVRLRKLKDTGVICDHDSIVINPYF